MTLIEAEAAIDRLSFLIGYNVGGNRVTNFAILPDQEDLITEIANALVDGNGYRELLEGFSSFSIIVYYDLEELLTTGLLKWDYLEGLIKKAGSSIGNGAHQFLQMFNDRDSVMNIFRL